MIWWNETSFSSKSLPILLISDKAVINWWNLMSNGKPFSSNGPVIIAVGRVPEHPALVFRRLVFVNRDIWIAGLKLNPKWPRCPHPCVERDVVKGMPSYFEMCFPYPKSGPTTWVYVYLAWPDGVIVKALPSLLLSLACGSSMCAYIFSDHEGKWG